MSGTAAFSEPVLTAVLRLAVMHLALDVADALARGGARPILLKGGSLDELLYPGGSPRRSVDVDLLVDPAAFFAAERVLEELGFEPKAPWRDDRTGRHWRRGTLPVDVDLHRSIVGVGASPEAAWRVLERHREPISIEGRALDALTTEARCLLLALHAIKHPGTDGQPLTDLRRGVQVVPEERWVAAAGLARELDAVPALAAGLRLDPLGAALAERLELPKQTTVEIQLVGRHVAGSLALNRIVELPSWSGRLRFAAKRAYPDPVTLRAMDHRIGDGAVDLGLGYARRTGWLVVHAPSAVRAVWQARRSARRPADDA